MQFTYYNNALHGNLSISSYWALSLVAEGVLLYSCCTTRLLGQGTKLNNGFIQSMFIAGIFLRFVCQNWVEYIYPKAILSHGSM